MLGEEERGTTGQNPRSTAATWCLNKSEAHEGIEDSWRKTVRDAAHISDLKITIPGSGNARGDVNIQQPPGPRSARGPYGEKRCRLCGKFESSCTARKPVVSWLEREEKPFLKGGATVIHYKKKKNPVDVAPSDYREGVWDLLDLEAGRACYRPITAKKGSQKTKKEETKKKPVPRRRPLMSKPVDDVYLTWYYERPSYGVEEAVGMLKKFQQLDFTHPKQFVYINVFLDMALQKKKKVDPFASTVLLPYRFSDEVNKVLVFTENEQEAEIARENGAAVVGGVELIKWILEDEIQVDFYVAVPAIMPKLIPLRNKLRRKYPSTKRNSLGHDIPKMLQLFREGLEYMVEDERVIKTRIARLDMPTEQIVANLKTVIHDICTFKPAAYGPFVQKLVIRSSTSEGLLLNLDGLLPQVEAVEEEEKNAEDNEEKHVQESVTT
ncbi:PREDICTED: 39S ribosomal protein L1, mitochondrial [Nipponia nippon]|uniref:39S ribosomal protein L1, mitochondrial n=1 Tax=Nipponia nippon TaxID=128390 RepID=UPI000510A23E|nr:PREDICTED: 39S ribosomal protein L1, mitochondrial [Nipponia nippon]